MNTVQHEGGSVKKKPISRAVEAVINRQDGTTAMRADGMMRNTDAGLLFVGVDQDNRTTRFTLNGDKLNGVGRPINSASVNMARILRNKIDRFRYQCGVKKAEECAGRSSSSIDRARRAELPFIRRMSLKKMNDGRLLAVEWMHDDMMRGDSTTGPTWVLFSDEVGALFVANLTMNSL